MGRLVEACGHRAGCPTRNSYRFLEACVADLEPFGEEFVRFGVLDVLDGIAGPFPQLVDPFWHHADGDARGRVGPKRAAVIRAPVSQRAGVRVCTFSGARVSALGRGMDLWRAEPRGARADAGRTLPGSAVSAA